MNTISGSMAIAKLLGNWDFTEKYQRKGKKLLG